jgi:UV DNA damage repair endonuclease
METVSSGKPSTHMEKYPPLAENLNRREDPNLKELIQRLIRTYYRSDAEKKAHLIGFLIDADPGEVKNIIPPPG